MKAIAISILAAATLAAGCASTTAPQQLASDTEACPSQLTWSDNGLTGKSSPQSGPSAKMERENLLTSKANCASNRAEAQLAYTRMQQRQNEARNFPSESPASN